MRTHHRPKPASSVPQRHREGHYDAIAERLFNTKHDRLLLEYDSERAGVLSRWKFSPKTKWSF
jgi:hypothetical protein